jgi:hypothetical protein
MPCAEVHADCNSRTRPHLESKLCLPHLELCVARREVKLLAVPRGIRYVTLPLHAQRGAVGVEHHTRVEKGVVCPLEYADRYRHTQLPAQLAQVCHCGVLGNGQRAGQRGRVLAEIWSLRKYGPSKSSGISTSLAPCDAAERTGRSAVAEWRWVRGRRETGRHERRLREDERRSAERGRRSCLPFLMLVATSLAMANCNAATTSFLAAMLDVEIPALLDL